MRRWLRHWWPRRASPTLSSLDAYARWAADYPPYAHNALMRCEESLMRQRFPDFTDKVVLDLACGSGRYGLIAAELGAARVIGCDNSAAMLAVNSVSMRTLAHTGAIPLAADSVDVLLCGLAIGHLPALDRTMREICRVLRPSGLALLSDFHPAQVASGGQRSFRDADGAVFTVEHYVHTEAAVRQVAGAADLTLLTVDEAAVPDAPSKAPALIVYQLLAGRQ